MKTFVRHIPTAARVLLGLIMFTFGLNFFLHFLPQPPVPGEAGAFLGALFASGYVFAIVKPVEIITGLLLLTNSFVPLALTLLAPITVAIVGFHAVLAPAGIGPALLVLVLHVALAYFYRRSFAPLFQSRAEPQPVGETQRSPLHDRAHAV
jgi:putative oxidoreductase